MKVAPVDWQIADVGRKHFTLEVMAPNFLFPFYEMTFEKYFVMNIDTKSYPGKKPSCQFAECFCSHTVQKDVITKVTA